MNKKERAAPAPEPPPPLYQPCAYKCAIGPEVQTYAMPTNGPLEYAHIDCMAEHICQTCAFVSGPSDKPLTSITHLGLPGRYCERCVVQLTFVCDCCTRMAKRSSARTISGKSVNACKTCQAKLCVSCTYCGALHYKKDIAISELSGEYICASSGCKSLEKQGRDDAAAVLRRGQVPRNTFRIEKALPKLGHPKDSIFYGVELEVVFDSRYDINPLILDATGGDYAFGKEDGSLPGNGVEIVTVPATLDVHRERMWKLLTNDQLKRSRGLSVESCCGLHIHVSRATITVLQTGKMLAFIHNKANFVFVRAIAGRHSVDWGGYNTHKEVRDVMNMPYNSTSRGSRYTAMNLDNSKTIEFRLFASSVDYSTVMARLEFIHALVNFTKPGETSIPDSSQYLKFVQWVSTRQTIYPKLSEHLINSKLIQPNEPEVKTTEEEVHAAPAAAKPRQARTTKARRIRSTAASEPASGPAEVPGGSEATGGTLTRRRRSLRQDGVQEAGV